MRNNKGFTLIELLAILVILAIIAVITTPIILGVIEDARKDAAVDKSWGTIDAIKLAYTQERFEADDLTDGKYVIANLLDKVKISGEQPTAGSFVIDGNGNVIITDFTFGNYKCSNTAADPNTITCTK